MNWFATRNWSKIPLHSHHLLAFRAPSLVVSSRRKSSRPLIGRLPRRSWNREQKIVRWAGVSQARSDWQTSSTELRYLGMTHHDVFVDRLVTTLWLLWCSFHLSVHILSIIFCISGFWSHGLVVLSACAQLSIHPAGKGFGCPTVAMVVGDIALPWVGSTCWRVLSQAPVISCSSPVSLVLVLLGKNNIVKIL